MPAGRPRTFDADKALDHALKVFWRKGYEGASLDDLTAAMRINRPSLYAAFGNKESLFRKALDRYQDRASAYMRSALGQPTARKFVEHLLRGSADALSSAGQPRGCLIVQGALTCGDDADCVRRELIARRLSSEAAIRKRLKRAAAEGDLPRGTNPAELAGFIATVIHGMSVQAASGATRAQLRKIAATALRAWPD